MIVRIVTQLSASFFISDALMCYNVNMYITKNPFCCYDLYAKSFVRNLIGPPVILNILSKYSQVRAKVVVVEILEVWLRRRRVWTEEFMEVLEVEENDVFQILLLLPKGI